MSTVKISQLPLIEKLNANTSNSLFMGVDIPSQITGKFTARTLAQGLYSNDVLNVGSNPVIFPNVAAQFSGNGAGYLQVNLQNFQGTGSSDFVATADTGTNANSFVDLGINGSQFNDPAYDSMKAYDSYLFSFGSGTAINGNLVIGTGLTGSNIVFAVGGTTSDKIVGRISSEVYDFLQNVDVTGDVTITGQTKSGSYKFADATVQTTAAASNAYSQAAFAAANTNAQNITLLQNINTTQNTNLSTANTFLQANDALTLSVAKAYTDTANTYLQANTGAALSVAKAYTDTANTFVLNASKSYTDVSNTFLQANDVVTLNSSKGYTDSCNTWLQANDVVTLNASKSYTDSSNTWLQSNTGATLAAAKSYTDSANSWLKTYTDTANTYSQNRYLSNTTGTFSGTLTITGDVHAEDLYATQNVYSGGIIFPANGTIQTTQGINNAKNINIVAAEDLAGYNGGIINIIGGDSTIAGGIGGDINLTPGTGNTRNGNVNISGSLSILNSTFKPNESAVTISGTPTVATPLNDGYMLHISGKPGVSSRVVSDAYGEGSYTLFAGRTARGNVTSPQAVLTGDVLLRMSGSGHDGNTFTQFGSGRIDIIASENHTPTSKGTQVKIYNTANGTNTLTNIATLNGESAIFSGVVNPQKGFIYTPNVVSEITNTITLDISNNSMCKFTINNISTIALTNFQNGKVVEVWLTNVDNNNHSVTHGCLANNSTVGTSSFTVAAGRSAYLRYFSIDGDQANTFVSINYS